MSEYIKIDKFENNVISLFIHKPYNFKRASVSEEEIKNQFKKIEKDINYNFKKVIRSHQSHTNVVKIITEDNIDEELDNVDGVITDLKGVALTTSVADCQGILLYDKKNKVIGNVHSGWRGTLSRISTNTINLMSETFDSNPSDIEVYISPCIHKCSFEVDEDLKNDFEKEFNDIDLTDIIIKGKIKENKQKYFIDTVELNKRVLINLGIKKENIESSDLCSVCNSEIIHSYRKDKPNDGRNVALICIK